MGCYGLRAVPMGYECPSLASVGYMGRYRLACLPAFGVGVSSVSSVSLVQKVGGCKLVQGLWDVSDSGWCVPSLPTGGAIEPKVG